MSNKLSRIIPEFKPHKFLQNIEVVDSGCWEWKGKLDKDGYGVFWIGSNHYGAHRASFKLFVKQLTPGLVIDHKCRNRKCVSPAHIREVTIKENSIENSLGPSAINSIKTHCINGHEFTSENTYIRNRPGSGRICKTCILNRCKKRDRLKYNEQQRNSYHKKMNASRT